jgi:hypothetical protein
MGVYKSLNTYRSSLSVSTCTIGLWTLSIGCDITNNSELLLSTSCRHDLVPEVQVITSMNSICLASWHTDYRFQRTLVLYEKNKAFCLVNDLSKIFLSFKISSLDSTTEIHDSKLDFTRIKLYKYRFIIHSRRK